MTKDCLDPNILTIGKLKLSLNSHELIIEGESIHLRSKLYALLKHLAQNSNQLVTRTELIETIWNGNYYIGEKGLTHAICMLRSLIKQASDCGVSINTVPKSGYLLRIKSNYQPNSGSEEVLETRFAHIDTSVPTWWPREFQAASLSTTLD